MKPEINAAAEFLSRIFLAHSNITKEKVNKFKEHLSDLLEERFRDHWHESCPTKGQAYRCIRVCPEEPLDPVLEKVCGDVGINVGDFNLPFELTLWVDPTEVVCKFGDLKCSYHTVAKKDQTSGHLDNQADHLDIQDLVENARDLYLKKQTVVIHPIHSSEMHIQNLYPDGGSNGFTMAIRVNGTMHYNMGGSPPLGYDGSPHGKNRLSHKHGEGYHAYGKNFGNGGVYMSTSVVNGAGSSTQLGYQHQRNNHHHHHHHNHQHVHGSGGVGSAYSNGYLNGYSEEGGVSLEKQAGSPTKMSIVGPVTQSSPTPEQIQQQVQHPPPVPPLKHTFSSPPSAESSSFSAQQQQKTPAAAQQQSSLTTVASSSVSSAGSARPSSSSSSSSNSKLHGRRGSPGTRSKKASPVKETK